MSETPHPKRSVGLITIHRIRNYGSALQTFATMQTLNKLGFDCTLIDYLYPTNYHKRMARGSESSACSLARRLRRMLGKIYHGTKILLQKIIIKTPQISVMEQNFDDFIAALPKTMPYDRKSILKNPPKFDIYLTGSDQTFNPRYMHKDYSFLLPFAPEKSTKIAYAASFGNRELIQEYRSDYATLLKKYNAISVRETSGIDLVRNLTGQEAVCMIDPTLLLDKSEWQKAAALDWAKASSSEPFILCYILGYVFNPYPQIIELIEQIRRLSNCKVMVICDSDVYLKDSGYEIIKDAGPREFLALYEKCSFVITTSFHGTAFAVNFQKPFYSMINGNSTDDRVGGFLKMVNLENRIVRLNDHIDLTETDLTVDFSTANSILAQKRQAAVDFLSAALNK